MDQLIFHGYCYGTALWYFLRGGCRLYDPSMVAGWFRPPVQRHMIPNDLELYNIYNDAWGLLSLGLLLVVLSLSVLPATSGARPGISLHAARLIVLVTVFHHVTTAFGAWDFYRRDSHYNTAMGIGVWANAWLTLVGLAACAVDFRPVGAKAKGL